MRYLLLALFLASCAGDKVTVTCTEPCVGTGGPGIKASGGTKPPPQDPTDAGDASTDGADAGADGAPD